jgi:hypothetical protein
LRRDEADRYATWRDLHFNDLEEKKKRDEPATAVMLKNDEVWTLLTLRPRNVTAAP